MTENSSDPEFLRKPEQPGPNPQPAPQPPLPPQSWGPPPPLRPDEERTWAVLGHLLPLVGLGFLAPLVIWLVFRGRGPYLEDQAKESLNFQLTLLIIYAIGFITIFILVGFVILAAAGIFQLVMAIVAAIAASKYQWYRYPLTIRFVK